MSVTIRTIGLAFNAALKSHCAIVAPSFAVLYAVHAVVMALINDDIDIATFKVTNPAATPAISGDQPCIERDDHQPTQYRPGLIFHSRYVIR